MPGDEVVLAELDVPVDELPVVPLTILSP
jgi:hypothetical protein